MKKTYYAPFLLLLLSVGFGGYGYYDEHYVSSDLRRSLVAASDLHNSTGEIRSYLHQARLQVRTKRDENLLERFQNGFELFTRALDLTEEARRDMDKVQNDFASFRPIAAGNPNLEEVKSTFRLRVAKITEKADVSKEDMANAQKEIAEVKRDLGLPPVPFFR